MTNILFTSLKLTNIKSYKTNKTPIQVNFGKGKNIIIGETGSGKTTILESLFFCLYNKYLKGNQEDLVTYDKKIGKIELEFKASFNDTISVLRHVNSKKQQDILRKNGKTERLGHKEITPKIEEIFGLDSDTFRNIIYAEQGQMIKILSNDREDRKKIFDKLLDIHKYQKTVKDLNKVIKNYNEEIKQKERKKKDKKERINELLPKREKYNKNLKEIEENNKRLENVSKQWKILDGELKKLKPKNEQYRKLTQSIEQNNNDLIELEKEYSEKMNKLSFRSTQENISLSKLKSLTIESDKLDDNKQVLAKQNEDYLEQINDLNHKKKLKEDYKVNLKHSKAILSHTLENKEKILQKIKDVTNDDQEIENKQAKDFPLIDLYKNKVRLNFQLKKTWIFLGILIILGLTSFFIPFIGLTVILPLVLTVFFSYLLILPLIKCYYSKQKLPDLFRELKDLHKRYKEIQNKIIEFESQYQTIKLIDFDKIDEYTKLRDKNSITIKNIEKDIRLLASMLSDANQWNKKNDKVSEEELKFEDLLKEFDPEDFNKKTNEFNKKSERKIELKTEIYNIEKLIEELSIDVSILEKLEEEFVNEQLHLEELNKENSICQSLHNIVDEFIPTVRRIRLNKLNHRANELLTDLGKNFTLEDIFVDESYSITVNRSNKKRSANHLSGGESIIIALALRLAVVEVMSQIKILFLDEPTAHLDSKSIDVLISCLENVSTFTQMIIITHNENFQSLADRFFKVNKNEKDISSISLIE